MMNREMIIKEFTENINDFKRLAFNIAGKQDADDLFQEASLMILEFDEERLISYYNKKEGLKPIFLRILINQYRSKTSKFHKLYRREEQFIQSKGEDIKYNEDQADIEKFTVCPEQLKSALSNVHKFNEEMFPNILEDMIFNLYVEKRSLRKALAAIPEIHRELFDLKKVHNIVKKHQKHIKKYLSNVNKIK